MELPLGESLPQQTPTGELANAVTHGVGLALSLAGGSVLIARSVASGNFLRIMGCGVFATALIAVYAASTLSHVAKPPWKRRFRILDQGLIYLLIVGTFTPLALEYLRSSWGWLLLMLMWVVALVGFVSKIWFTHRIDAVTIWSYVVLGWLPIMPAAAYAGLVPEEVQWRVLIGGLCYTAGTIFLVLDVRRFQFHAIWHLFVIAGSACHFAVVLQFVASRP
jgi:hemolysin III